jgi:hypothetical protein
LARKESTDDPRRKSSIRNGNKQILLKNKQYQTTDEENFSSTLEKRELRYNSSTKERPHKSSNKQRNFDSVHFNEGIKQTSNKTARQLIPLKTEKTNRNTHSKPSIISNHEDGLNISRNGRKREEGKRRLHLIRSY